MSGFFGGFFGSSFGAFFGSSGGSPPPPPPTPGSDEDCPIVARALSRLITRFQKPQIIALLRAFAKPACELETMFLALIAQVGVDDSSGVQLDVIGRIVGQKRNGLIDADYRRYLRARIQANRSDGSIAQIYKVARLVINDASVTLRLVNDGAAGYTLLVAGGLLGTPTLAALLVFLRATTAAGVRILIDHTTVADDEAFTLPTVTYTTVASLGIGSTAFNVDDATSFPATGTLVLDGANIAAGSEETIVYTSRLATVFFLASPTTHTHEQFTTVVLAESLGRGCGSACYVTAPASIADTHLTVDDATTLPASGNVEIDGGTSIAEIIAYSSATGTTVTLSAPLVHAHAVSTAVVCTDDTGALDGVLVT